MRRFEATHFGAIASEVVEDRPDTLKPFHDRQPILERLLTKPMTCETVLNPRGSVNSIVGVSLQLE
jgi:hypothetical protein